MFDFQESDSQRSSLKKHEHYLKPIVRDDHGKRTSGKSKRGAPISKNSDMESDGNLYLNTIDDLKS